ncbi:Holliday junction resolvase RuvX [Anaerotignum faecicola]|nr:Holliday junction resolvase RuvX [Anaerotignum faecicola]
MRILGLDLGSKTVGVAVSDPFGWTAQGLEIIRRNSENEYKQSLGRLEQIIGEYEVEKIVLGYPLNLDGTVSERCLKTDGYKEKLERRFPKIPVILWDERLSTVAAAGFLAEAGLDSAKRKNVIDKMAAVYILQGYLDSIKDE